MQNGSRLGTGAKIAIIIGAVLLLIAVTIVVVLLNATTLFKSTTNQENPQQSSTPLQRTISGEELFYSDIALYEGYDFTRTFETLSASDRETVMAVGREACRELGQANFTLQDGEGYIHFLAGNSLCPEHKSKIDRVLGRVDQGALEAFKATLFDGTEYLSVLLHTNTQCVLYLTSYTVNATPEDQLLLCNVLRSYLESDWAYVQWLYGDEDEVARTLERYAGAVGDADTSGSLVNTSRKLQVITNQLNEKLKSRQ